jgi:hypothetical protein
MGEDLMTWSFNAGGHHNKSYYEWEEDEYKLLEDFVYSVSIDNNVVTTFQFNGNHISVKNLAEAEEVLIKYRQKLQAQTEEQFKNASS